MDKSNLSFHGPYKTGVSPGIGLPNEPRRYILTTTPISWPNTVNDTWKYGQVLPRGIQTHPIEHTGHCINCCNRKPNNARLFKPAHNLETRKP